MAKIHRAEKICKQLKNKLNYLEKLEVHSVFENAVNLICKDSLVTIVPQGKPLYPNSILLADNINFATDMKLRQGMIATVDTDNLIIAEETIGLCGAEEKELHVDTLVLNKPRDLEKRIVVLRNIVRAKANGEGLSPIIDANAKQNIYSSFLKPRIEGLLSVISSENTDEVLLLTEKIAGCGIGLTPSSDDFLCGLMAVLLADAITKNKYGSTQKLTKEMAVNAIPKTGFISGQFLRSSAEGYLSEDSLELIAQIYSDRDLQQLEKSALNVAKFGATSGTDTLCGVILALEEINKY